jgi:ATP phosphoribosyltransferase regulatory subunit
LLFSGGLLADAEILLLLADCFDGLAVLNWQIILGEAGLTRSLLSLSVHLQEQVKRCLALLDYVGLENLPYPNETLRSKPNNYFTCAVILRMSSHKWQH